jgi:hypothetical protein
MAFADPVIFTKNDAEIRHVCPAIFIIPDPMPVKYISSPDSESAFEMTMELDEAPEITAVTTPLESISAKYALKLEPPDKGMLPKVMFPE